MDAKLVLIIGGADTGRAPMAAALLRRLVAREGLGWRVESAGIVGHDGDPAEPEARATMVTMGLAIDGHEARSLDEALVAAAAVLVAVERGVALVLRERHPAAQAKVVTLGELAGRARDIPDPFRMQLGAWLQYAIEIETLLRAGLSRLRVLLGEAQAEPARAQPPPEPVSPPAHTPDPARIAVAERAARLLTMAADLPGVLDWAVAGAQLQADLAALEAPQTPDDLARAYVTLLRARLGPTPPSEAEARALAAAVGRLRVPIGAADLERLAREGQ